MTKMHKIILSIILITASVLSRTFLHYGPNVEFVTTATIISGLYLMFPYVLLVPIFSMLISDIYIGNTNIFIFTWSAYIFIGLLSTFFQKYFKKSKIKVINITAFSLFSSVFFFIWTNFGVWLLDLWGMYPRNISGLLQAYIMGLPFLKYQIIGNMIFTPSAYILMEMYISYLNRKSYSKLTGTISNIK